MLDLFDFMGPRVLVVSDKQYKDAKRKRLEQRRDLYQEALDGINKELKELKES